MGDSEVVEEHVPVVIVNKCTCGFTTQGELGRYVEGRERERKREKETNPLSIGA